MLYKVGDKVLIRTDLIEDEYYIMSDDSFHDSVNDSMMSYLGEIATITGIRRTGGYMIDLDEGSWNWTDDMFNRRVGKTDLSLSPFQSWEKQNAI